MIGGTQFVGRALVELALSERHTVTLFHRGKTNPDLFPESDRLHRILGDRDEDLSALSAGTWDAVVDCVGYFPRQTESMAKALVGRVPRYAFISTISVYAPSQSALTEASPRLSMPEGTDPTVVNGQTYGPLKVECEDRLNDIYGGKALHIRAGLQIGAHDHTDRFSNWVERIGRNEAVIVPDEPEPMQWQLIDALDTARFTLHALELGLAGAYNVTGEVRPMMETLLGVQAVVSPDTEFVKWSPEKIAAAGLQPWTDLALWIPQSMRAESLGRVDISKAREAGLSFRPMSDTVAEIWKSVQRWPDDRVRRVGLDPARERELLVL